MDYDICLEIVNKLDAIRDHKLRDSPVAEQVARLMHDYDVMELGYLNDLVQSLFASQSGENSGSLQETKLTPDTLLTSDYLAYSLKATVKAIRTTYFGGEEPPFSDEREARRWRTNLYERMAKELKEGKGILTSSPEKRKFWDIIGRAQAISGETGLSPVTILNYILADIKPLLVPYEIRLPGRGLSSRVKNTRGRRQCWWVDVRINTELGFDDLLRIYSSIKRYLGVKRGKKLNEGHFDLHRMVQRRGGAPKGKGTVAFWNSVKGEWNEKHPSDAYETWKGVKITYDRINNRLKNRFPVTLLHENGYPKC